MYIKAPFGSTILLNCPKSHKTNALYNKLTIAGIANNIEPKYTIIPFFSLCRKSSNPCSELLWMGWFVRHEYYLKPHESYQPTISN